MGDAVFFAWLVITGLLGVLLAVLVADAIYAIAGARPGFLPFARMIRHRVPATELDCVRLGASQIVMALGLLLTLAPTAALSIVNYAGPLHLLPPLVQVAVFLMASGSFLAAAGCLFAGAVVMARVQYKRLDRDASPSASRG